MATASDFQHCIFCKNRQLANAACVWCHECEDAFCTGCNEYHSVSRATRDHNTIPAEKYQKLPPFILSIRRFCEEHYENFQMYCLIHEKPLCKKCIVTTHNECKDIATLDDVTGNIKSSWAMKAVEKRAHEIIQTFKEIEDDGEKNLADIFEAKNSIVKQISDIREQVNRHLDVIQKNMVDELLSFAEKHKERVSVFLESLKTKRQSIDEIPDTIARIKMYASDFQAFLGLQEMEKKVYEGQKYIQSAFDDGMLNQVKIEYSIDENMKHFALVCPTFGKLSKSTTAPTIQLPTQSCIEVQVPKFREPMTGISSVDNIRFKSEREIQICNISNITTTGCCALSNGTIIFACLDSNILAVHGIDGSYQSDILTNNRVIDVTPVDQKTVAATTGFQKKILFFEVHTGQTLSIFDVGKSCYGVAFRDGSLIFCVSNCGLKMLNVETLKMGMTFREENLGTYSFVTTFEDKTYFTNTNTKTLKVLDANMKEIWRFHDESVLLSPRGVAVDSKGHVYVADGERNRLVVMSPYGEQRKHLVIQTKISLIEGLCYDEERSRIIVVDYKGKYLFLDCSS